MSANVNEKRKMFSVREVPWHGTDNCRVLPSHPKTIEELIVAAGHDFQVAEMPVTVTLPDGTVLTSDNHKAIVNLTDGQLLSVMGGRYKANQPRDLAEFAYALLEVDPETQKLAEAAGMNPDEPAILFETGMVLGNPVPEVITLMARLPKDILIGGTDKVVPYIGFTDSFNGSLKFGVHCTPVREVCQNTLNLGLSRATQQWSVKHTASMADKIAEARKSLGLTFAYMAEFETAMNALLDQPFTKGNFEAMVTKLFPKGTKELAPFSNEQYAMIGLLESSPTIDDGIRYTKYGALNAIREYDDWGRRFNDTSGSSVADRRTMATLFGKSKDRSDVAMKYLVAAK